MRNTYEIHLVDNKIGLRFAESFETALELDLSFTCYNFWPPIVCSEKFADYPKRLTLALDCSELCQRNCNDVRLLSSVHDAMTTVRDMRNEIISFVDKKKDWYRRLIKWNQPKPSEGRKCRKRRNYSQAVTFRLQLIGEHCQDS